ncbi:MAG: hypothetical protein ACRDDH_09270 [Cetobacterium sp.]|uniref:hypothetical protein n=1 Tax=Cetobacterium sp. TaxID=2071632 RepID=UPI003EE800FB
MASQKLYKISKIVKEMVAAPDGRYNIDGINLGLAKFLWRETQLQFDDLNPGDYRIEETGGSTFLVITSEGINKDLEAVQVAYILDFTSSRYETEYDVDINTLKNKFNLLVDDTLNMWEHLRKNGMISDVEGFDIILPELDTDEVWVKTATGFRGFSIGSLEDNIKGLIEEFKQMADSYLAELNKVGQQWVTDVTNTGSSQNDIVLNQGSFQVNRINEASADIDNRLQMIWRMYSILTGSQRFLSGGVLTLRDLTKIEKDVNGGSIGSRTGEARRYYDGGSVANRTIKVPMVMDLGEY